MRYVARCGRLAGRRSRGVGIGSGSGKRSPLGPRARMPLPLRRCRRRSGRDGSVRLEGCRQSRWLRFRSGTCLPPSGKRSRSCTLNTSACAGSLAVWVVPRRRSRGSSATTRRPVAMRWCIGPRLRSGTRSGAPAVPSSASSPRMTGCASTCRIASLGRSPDPTASWCLGPTSGGSVAGTVAVRTAAGRDRGVPSRSRTGSGSTSPMMTRCASVTRRSTRRSTSKVVALSNESSSPACAPDGRCVFHAHVPRREARSSSAPTS